jgi:glycosyltransferase involved in cell wall biosynthesis
MYDDVAPMRDKSLVSVVIPTFNAGHMIEEAIDSVRKQTWQAFEIIVVDDGSSDGTAARLEKYTAVPGFTYIQQANRGSYVARNVGIEKARGEYIAFLDADDVWFQDKLARQMELMRAEPELGMVCSDYVHVDATGKMTPSQLPREALATTRELFLPLLRRLFVLTSTVVVRRAVFERIGGFDESLGGSGDRELFLRIARAYPVGFMPHVFVYYRHHTSNLTNQLDDRLPWDTVVYERLRSGKEPLSLEEQRETATFLRHRYRRLARYQLGRHRAQAARDMLRGLARLRWWDSMLLLYPLTYAPTTWVASLRRVSRVIGSASRVRERTW